VIGKCNEWLHFRLRHRCIWSLSFFRDVAQKLLGDRYPIFSIHSSGITSRGGMENEKSIPRHEAPYVRGSSSSCTNLFDGCPCKCRRLLECRKGRDSLIGIATPYRLYLTPAWARFSFPVPTGPETPETPGPSGGGAARAWCRPPTPYSAGGANAFELSSPCLRKQDVDDYLFHQNVGL